MAQADMDGGSGGWLKTLGGNVAQAVADTINRNSNSSNSAERQTDISGTEDVSGQPTAVQRAAAGNVGAVLSDTRTLMIGGGILLAAMSVFLLATRK